MSYIDNKKCFVVL